MTGGSLVRGGGGKGEQTILPGLPVIVAPPAGAVDVDSDAGVTIVTALPDFGAGTTPYVHTSSEFEVYRVSDRTLLHKQKVPALTLLVAGIWSHGVEYAVRVRHQGLSGAWTNWSPLAQFTTRPPPGWAVGVDWWRDFRANIGTMPTPSDVHDQTIHARDAAGIYRPFAPGALVRTDLGLQTVPTRNNLFLFASDFTQWWGLSAVTVSPNAVVAPDGTLSADIIAANGANAQHFVIANNTVNNGVTRVVSFFAKRITANFIHIVSTGENMFAQFDLATGSLVFSSAGAGILNWARSEDVGDGWWRFSMSFRQDSGFIRHVRCYPLASAEDIPNPSQTTDASMALWGATLENDTSFLTPPIITTGVAMTVSGNIPAISGIDFRGGMCGFIDVDIRQPASSEIESRIFEIDDGSSDNRIFLFCNRSVGTVKLLVTVNKGTSNAQDLGAWHEGPQTIVFAIGPGIFKQRRVGEADRGQFPCSFPTSVTKLAFGAAPYTNNHNTFQSVRRFALNFGPPTINDFNDMWDRAQP